MCPQKLKNAVIFPNGKQGKFCTLLFIAKGGQKQAPSRTQYAE